MANALLNAILARATDLHDELVNKTLSPIDEYADEPLVSLEKAVAPVTHLFINLEENVVTAKQSCCQPKNSLTVDEGASIYLYTMEFPTGFSLYRVFNQILRSERRDLLINWFKYLKLFLTALFKLESVSTLVWRGVSNVDLSRKYKTGDKFTWWSVISCTTSLDVLERSAFLGKTGIRTLFSIECQNGKMISKHSCYGEVEKEIVLIPGTQFEVMGQANPAEGLLVIHLKEIPPYPHIKPPFPMPQRPRSVATEPSRYSYSELQLLIGRQINHLTCSLDSLKLNDRDIFVVTSLALEIYKVFTTLNLNGNQIGDNGVKVLADALDHNTTITALNLSDNRIGDAGAQHLADVLQRNKTLQELMLDNNEIRDQGAEYLAEAVQHNETLTTLALGANKIGDHGAMHLANALQNNQRLKTLNLNKNRITTTGAKSLSAAITSKKIQLNLIDIHLQSDPSLHNQESVLSIARWKQNGITVAGGSGRGGSSNQLDSPQGLYVNEDQAVIIVDHYNHRIVEWKKGDTSGRIVAGGNEKGSRMDQFNGPIDMIVDKAADSLIICDGENRRVIRWSRRIGTTSGEEIVDNIACGGLAMDKERNLYITDIEKHEVRLYRMGEKEGRVVAGGNGKGERLDQLNRPRCLFVDEDYSIYVSDTENHRIMKWMKNAKEGIVVAGHEGEGNDLTQLSYPTGVFVDVLGIVYVVDGLNHRVIRLTKGMKSGEIIVGGNGRGEQANQLNNPMGLSFDRDRNLYVVDRGNHRIQRFDIEKN